MLAKYHDWMMMDDKDSRSTSWTSAMKEYYKYKHILLYNFSFTLVKICLYRKSPWINLKKSTIFVLIENKTDQRNQSQPELFVYLTDSWAPGVSALFQLDSTSAELFYGLLLQKGKVQKDLFLFLVIEFAQFCLLSRTALVPLTVIHWLLSIFQWTKWRLKKKKNGDFFSTFILENKHFKIIFSYDQTRSFGCQHWNHR